MKTVTPSITLWVRCDGCDAADHWVNLKEEAAREHAESEGWRLSETKDLCPECAAEPMN